MKTQCALVPMSIQDILFTTESSGIATSVHMTKHMEEARIFLSTVLTTLAGIFYGVRTSEDQEMNQLRHMSLQWI